MSELGPVTRAEKAEDLLRWAIHWLEYAGHVPLDDDYETEQFKRYEEAKELLK